MEGYGLDSNRPKSKPYVPRDSKEQYEPIVWLGQH